MRKENHTKHAILGLLTTGCHSGYSIKQMMDRSLNHFWKVSYGQIYPTLKQLVDEELATVEETAQEKKPDKKEYFITPKGKKALQQWVQTPIQEIPAEKNEWLLKLFFSQPEDRESLLSHLSTYSQKLHERFQAYEAIEQMIESNYADKQEAQFWLMTLDYGQRTTRAAIEWCECTIEKIDQL
ncbi:PadR family transcriptional regulator [Bacillus badius]|uniref:PadR family transcriptional regulator n=1 Tax=Bacillus badius TaxID=1455 RepID=UPI0005979B58|nr:PadR family transcriptional regulator [Bacillus badius]KIL76154.1 Transcriptional regulator, PadR family [Bacillus badius]MED0668327.1 PadR family transcriptional regulator [Bacillus badius]